MKNKIILSLFVLLAFFLVTGCTNKEAKSKEENKAENVLNEKLK